MKTSVWKTIPNTKPPRKLFCLVVKPVSPHPFPWVAPYIEAGIGASIGSFETFTPTTNIKEKGMILHIPFTLGLALGTKHSVEIEFTYYFQPAVEQVSGAAALGISFPIK